MTETIYLSCAIVGGTLLVCQFVCGALGFGGHHDVGGDHDFHDPGMDDLHDAHGGHGHHDGHSAWYVSILTFRSVVAALTFFGLVGLAASVNWQLEPAQSFAAALAGGAAALFGVAYLMQGLHRLKSDGTIRIERAVGATGTVYVAIPGQKTGAGKVMLRLQNRIVEYQAVTPHQQLASGDQIVVTAVLGPDTLEVVPQAESQYAARESTKV